MAQLIAGFTRLIVSTYRIIRVPVEEGQSKVLIAFQVQPYSQGRVINERDLPIPHSYLTQNVYSLDSSSTTLTLEDITIHPNPVESEWSIN